MQNFKATWGRGLPLLILQYNYEAAVGNAINFQYLSPESELEIKFFDFSSDVWSLLNSSKSKYSGTQISLICDTLFNFSLIFFHACIKL